MADLKSDGLSGRAAASDVRVQPNSLLALVLLPRYRYIAYPNVALSRPPITSPNLKGRVNDGVDRL